MECVAEVVPPQAGEPVFEIREPGYGIARKLVYNWASGDGAVEAFIL